MQVPTGHLHLTESPPMSTDDTDHDDPELLRPDAVAPVDEPEQRLYPDQGPNGGDTASPLSLIHISEPTRPTT